MMAGQMEVDGAGGGFSLWQNADISDEVLRENAGDIARRTRLLDNEIKALRDDVLRNTHEIAALKEKMKDNLDKIKLNKQLPYLVGHVTEKLDLPKEEDEDDGSSMAIEGDTTSVVIKTSTRQSIYLPVVGLVDPKVLKPDDLVGVNKDNYLILDTLPTEYDSRVKTMEVDEKPNEEYSDIGGLDKQIQELYVRPTVFKSIRGADCCQTAEGAFRNGFRM